MPNALWLGLIASALCFGLVDRGVRLVPSTPAARSWFWLAPAVAALCVTATSFAASLAPSPVSLRPVEAVVVAAGSAIGDAKAESGRPTPMALNPT